MSQLHDLNLLIPTRPDQWDGDWRLIEYDKYTGVADWHRRRVDGGRVYIDIRTVQHNIQTQLDLNQKEANLQINSRWGDGKRVASIPPLVFNALGLDEALANGDMQKFARVLNDGDNRKLRTFEGVI